jgi:hypothetical protein
MEGGMKHLAVGSALCLLLCAGPGPAEAQGVAWSFEQLGVLVKPGDKITVVDAAGTRADGRIGLLTGDTLTLATPAGLRNLAEADVTEIRQRRQDSLTNGAIIGAAAATGYFLTMLAIFGDDDGGGVLVGPAIAGGVMFAGMGAAAGVGIDALITRKQTIYRKNSRPSKLTVSPLVGRGRRGVAVSVRF